MNYFSMSYCSKYCSNVERYQLSEMKTMILTKTEGLFCITLKKNTFYKTWINNKKI